MKLISTLALTTMILAFAFAGAFADTPAFRAWALTPPMGWNSYDAYGDSVTEDETLANATYMKDHLLAHGWRYVIVDFRWYDPKPLGDDQRLNRERVGAVLTADAAGRLQPSPNRFSTAADGNGFKGLADKLHAMGLRFGFHIMRGIPRQAVLAATPIADSTFNAADAGDPSDKCTWCPDMFGVKANPAGQAWYDSIFKQYAAWGTDFVKVDDLSQPYHADEIEMIRKAIDKCGRPIVFSTSPGQTPVASSEHVRANANMWRISGDFWDRWNRLNEQFDLLAKWQWVAVPGSWPDADMIPFGRIAIRSRLGGTDHTTHFTRDEQRTLIALWSIAQSPLMLGANLPDLDTDTLALLANDEILAIDQDPQAKPGRRAWQSLNGEIWTKPLKGGSIAVGAFNRGDTPLALDVPLADIGVASADTARDLFAHADLGTLRDRLNATIPPHAVVLLRLTGPKSR